MTPLKRCVNAFLLFLTTLFIATPTARAVNFYDGARAPRGTYFLTYTSLSTADEITNPSGSVVLKNVGLLSLQETFRLCYYSPDFVATVLLPFAYLDIDSLGQDSHGLGDIHVGFGHFLPVRQFDVLPMIFFKYPTGEYSTSKAANIGSNQPDIKPMVFFHKTWGSWSMDASAKYFFRLKNEATDLSPGDELHLQTLLGYRLTEKFKLGPSLNWMVSQDREQNGDTVRKSARETFSVGADFYYRFPGFSVTLTYLYDAYTENTPRGHFFQIKTVYGF